MNRRRTSGLVALSAVMCLLSFVFEVSSNCACDLEMKPSAAVTAIAANHAGSDADPCGASCVPDCCCCTPSLPAVRMDLDLDLQPISGFFASGIGEPRPGISLVPYHPPSGLL